jgi:hypothetical protein
VNEFDIYMLVSIAVAVLTAICVVLAVFHSPWWLIGYGVSFASGVASFIAEWEAFR